MSCYSPLAAWKTAGGAVVFQELRRHGELSPLQLPCGQCIGCRVQRAQDWAARCAHEAQCHAENCWLTLTYDDHNLPPGNSLRYRDFQLFLKRLRKAVRPQIVRYYMCGEYGETTQRPHYHVCLFGIYFHENALHSNSKGKQYFTSPLLTKLWPHGTHLFTQLNSTNAQYTALYITEKITGDAGVLHYGRRVPPFNRMSLKPAIGSRWLARYLNDVRSGDAVILDGRAQKPPKFYDKLHKRMDPESFRSTQFDRDERSFLGQADRTPDRLKVRETVASARLNLKVKTL